ncbi:MAG: LemA family protein [Synergistales bacterium]|nr:LemA family protein [Synergistales bacterium]
MMYFLGLIIVTALLAFIFVGIYNRMIRMRNLVDEGWSGIDVQLKRRSNLVINIVETVKGYASHEKEVFSRVTEARSRVAQAGTVEERASAENVLTGALKTLFAVAENYPELKANQNFLQLQQTLSDLENEIQMARRYYNGSVRDYNNTIQVFPNSIIASMFNFDRREYFEAEEEAREVPRVSFQ